MTFKEGITPLNTKVELLWTLLLLEPVFLKYGQPLVITGLAEPGHAANGWHPKGGAADCRSWNIHASNYAAFQADCLAIAPWIWFEPMDQAKDHFHIDIRYLYESRP